MSQQSNNPQQPATPNSLASRLANRLSGNQQNASGQPGQANAQTQSQQGQSQQSGQQQQQGQQNNPPQPQRSPFGRPGNAQQNNAQQNNAGQNNAPAAPAPRFGGPFGAQNQRTWTMQPVQKTVVHFELRGLGDPFYRLLGRELNPDFGDFKMVSAALERAEEGTADLVQHLDKTWESYRLMGAVLVYPWNPDAWKVMTAPPPAPQENTEEDGQQPPQPAPVKFIALRAIDLQLVLNVLARSRSQVLLTRAPLVLSQEYLNRSLISDDPRLVALVRATGFMEEG